jgi:predicted MPP superfamily phosphohydrolase
MSWAGKIMLARSFFSLCVSVVLLWTGSVFSKSPIAKLAPDHFRVHLSKQSQDSIVILQVTDLHLGNPNDHRGNFQTLRRIKKFVDQYNPDIIAVTGDLFTGKKVDREYLVAFAVQFFDGLQRPWFLTFGNHDPEGGYGRREIATVISASQWGMVGLAPTDSSTDRQPYKIDLYTEAQSQPVWEFYAFDSGSKLEEFRITANQIEWFHQQVESSRNKYRQLIPALAFFHVPLKQFALLAADSTLSKKGEFHEAVCYEQDTGQVYDQLRQPGILRAIFCGHDHDNNYWGYYPGGILLVYGHVSGDAGYHRHWAPGAKVVTLPHCDGSIGILDLVGEPTTETKRH